MTETPEIEAWLAGVLLTDAGLAAVVSARVYAYQAPQAAPYPFVLFSLTAPDARSTSDGTQAFAVDLYTVKVVGRGSTMAGLAAAAARIDALLSGVSAETTGGLVLRVRKVSAISRIENDVNGVRYNHLGGMYRITAS